MGVWNQSVQSGILKLITSRIFYKNCKTFVFLPSLDTPKKIGGFRARSPATEFDVPCQIHDTTSVSEQMQLSVMRWAFSFSMHIPRDIPLVSTLHTFLLSSVDGQNVALISSSGMYVRLNVVVISVSGMLLWMYNEKLSTHERRFHSALWLADISYDNRSTVNRSHRKLKVGMTEPFVVPKHCACK